MHLNRFDDKEIAIWILMAVIVGFVSVRAIQMVLMRWVLKRNGREKLSTMEKELEKVEMVSYGDETVSVASTAEENDERDAKKVEMKSDRM